MCVIMSRGIRFSPNGMVSVQVKGRARITWHIKVALQTGQWILASAGDQVDLNINAQLGLRWSALLRSGNRSSAFVVLERFGS